MSPPEPNPDRQANRWRGSVQRASAATGVLAVVAAIVATVFVARTEPRLFTLRELLPPDEGLITAYLLAAVFLAVALSLRRSARSMLASVEVGPNEWLFEFGSRAASHRTIVVPSLELAGGRLELRGRDGPAMLVLPGRTVILGPIAPELVEWLTRRIPGPSVRPSGEGAAAGRAQ